jgi:hypothetical protein
VSERFDAHVDFEQQQIALFATPRFAIRSELLYRNTFESGMLAGDG